MKSINIEYFGVAIYDNGKIIPELSDLCSEFAQSGYNISLNRRLAGLGGGNYEIVVTISEYLKEEFIEYLVKSSLLSVVIRVFQTIKSIDSNYDASLGYISFGYDNTTITIYVDQMSLASFKEAYDTIVQGILFLINEYGKEPREIILPVFEAEKHVPLEMKYDEMPAYLRNDFPYAMSITKEIYQENWFVQFHDDNIIYLFNPISKKLIDSAHVP